MKAYYIGGPADLTKKIIDDNDPPKMDCVIRPANIVSYGAYPRGQAPAMGVSTVIYDYYQLLKLTTLGGEVIALYLYDEGMANGRTL
jgi:hypothetical protein